MPQVFRQKSDTKILVALGGNVTSAFGTPLESVQSALLEVETESLRLLSKSALYRTPCFPAGAGPDFVNAAAVYATRLSPEAVLKHLHSVEARFGRTRAARWDARTLDLDLLAYGDCVLPDADTLRHWIGLPLDEQKRRAPEQLILPHPRMQDRGFVLVPLADVAPDWRHPVLDKTVLEMLQALPEAEKADITRL